MRIELLPKGREYIEAENLGVNEWASLGGDMILRVSNSTYVRFVQYANGTTVSMIVLFREMRGQTCERLQPGRKIEIIT